MMKKLTAVDLYSGAGGWSYGLRLAGIDVVASYDIWDEANLTNSKNNHHRAKTVDIRRLDPQSIPIVDVIVGSPPCTSFSLSNRGGSGDIREGLRDVSKFFEVVESNKPAAWFMENVPRAKTFIDRELTPGGSLERFADMPIYSTLIDTSNFGIPQRRRRCIYSNIPFSDLNSQGLPEPLKLAQIVACLSQSLAVDPIYGGEACEITQHNLEPPLTLEEEWLNKYAKTNHRIYNKMSFPDHIDGVARTITATCSRISRESIIIKSADSYRRLTLRERATLQTFPLKYQFFSRSYESAQKMIGNAFPPLMAYYLARRITGCEPLAPPTVSPPCATSPGEELAYTPRKKRLSVRAFRQAIPSLNFGSGVRFELRHTLPSPRVPWEVVFVYGTAKQFHEITADDLAVNPAAVDDAVFSVRLRNLSASLECVDWGGLHENWLRRTEVETGPLALLQLLDKEARQIEFGLLQGAAPLTINNALKALLSGRSHRINRRAASMPEKIMAGLLIMCGVAHGPQLSRRLQ